MFAASVLGVQLLNSPAIENVLSRWHARQRQPFRSQTRLRARPQTGERLIKDAAGLSWTVRQGSFNPGAVDLPRRSVMAEHPWQAPLPSFTWPQRNISLPALLLASPSAFSRCVRCLRKRRFFNPRRLRNRYIGQDHVIDIGYCFTNGGHGLRTDIFTRKNRRFSDSFSLGFRDIVRNGGQVDAGPD